MILMKRQNTYFEVLNMHIFLFHKEALFKSTCTKYMNFLLNCYMYFINRQMKRQNIMQLPKSGITSLLSHRSLLSICFLIMWSNLVYKV